MMYTLVDCETGLTHGPYDSANKARIAAYDLDLKKWEIIVVASESSDDMVVDWS